MLLVKHVCLQCNVSLKFGRNMLPFLLILYGKGGVIELTVIHNPLRKFVVAICTGDKAFFVN